MTTVTFSPPIGTPPRVDIGDPYHLMRWCRRFGVTEQQLRTAVRIAGAEVAAVEQAIRRARAGTSILVSEHRLGEDRDAD
ncbi:MAG: DUF3606 domain-containing protein [Alphaproteobacteria bacterium]|nr:DUF3606 domain-containing protein [Alphaproteobacteria bacterium]